VPLHLISLDATGVLCEPYLATATATATTTTTTAISVSG
jgi:hypothetical protein